MTLVEHLRTWDDIPEDDLEAFRWLDLKTAEAADLIEKQAAQIEMMRDAIPEGWVLVPKQPTFPMLIALNEVAIEVAGLGYSDGPQKILTEGYAAMLAATPKGEVK